jgi:hypothetical protein
MVKKNIKNTQPETPEPPQIMNPHLMEEREKKKQPLSGNKKGVRRKKASKRKKD